MKFVFYILSLFIFIGSANALVISEQDVLKAVAQEADNDNLEFEVFAGQTSFDIEKANKFKLLVSNLKMEDLQNKFSCSLEVFVDNKPYATTTIMGRYSTLQDVYVLNKSINKGELITEEMLKNIKVKSNKVKAIHLTEKDKMIGFVAKKNLPESRLISQKDIGKVFLIKKNDSVSVVYVAKQMQIVIKAIALADGGKGDKIEVMNTSSKKSIFGRVLDKDTVIIEGENNNAK